MAHCLQFEEFAKKSFLYFPAKVALVFALTKKISNQRKGLQTTQMAFIKTFLLLTFSTASFSAPLWWKRCDLLDLTHPLVDGEHAHALKDYAENPFRKKVLIKGEVASNSAFDSFYVHYNKVRAESSKS